MSTRSTRGAYRKEERARLPLELQKELVERAAQRHGTCQGLAKALNIPKSSVHYYRTGRLTVPLSVVDRMLKYASDQDLEKRVADAVETLDRTWANYHSSNIMREMCRERLRLPTRKELESDDDLRRKAAAIVSYVMAEGSIWLQKEKWRECAVNITFAEHETDLYEHFRGLVLDVFGYDIGPPQAPGNGAKAIRGFIYSRFVAEWLLENGVPKGEKSNAAVHFPSWVFEPGDAGTLKAALQPWCDGEGWVSRTSLAAAFSITQSRHTSLTYYDLPQGLMNEEHRYIIANKLDRVSYAGLPVLAYCRASCRSEILDGINTLCNLLGLGPTTSVNRLALKDDGFWSCVWRLDFTFRDARRLLDLGLVRQVRKRDALRARYRQ